MVNFNPDVLVAIGILVLLAVLAIALVIRRKRSRALAERFGPEYARTVERTGSRSRAEAELAARQQRVRKLHIIPLEPRDAQRYRLEWQALQSRFVDNPRTAVAEADLLVRDVMTRRGYPVADFDTEAADLSVDHPVVVEHYRAAHEIALRDRHGEADTEALRQALVHYRALFAELLEVAEEPLARQAPTPRVRQPLRPPIMQPERAMARDEMASRERDRERDRIRRGER